MIQISGWKKILILGISLLGILFAFPNSLPQEDLVDLPDWLPKRQVNLGLDLQGGAHLLVEVDVDTVMAERLGAMSDQIRRRFREDRIGYTGLRVVNQSISLTIRKPEQVDKARQILRDLSRSESGSSSLLSGLGGAAGPDYDVSAADTDRNVTVSMTEQAMTDQIQAIVQQSVEVIRRRIDPTGTLEPLIQRQGQRRILIQVPGISETEVLKSRLSKTAKLYFKMVTEQVASVRSRPKPGNEIVPSEELGPDGKPLSYYMLEKRALVTGENLVDASQSFQDAMPVVFFRFDSVGAKKFGQATRANVNRLFAIVLDNKVISAPRINEPILGGSGIISGNFTVQSAQELSLLLRAGALPAPLTILEERTVGPGLGADSIAAGEIASGIGLVAVIIFMVIVYGRFGLMADVALIINMILILGTLSMLQATLTLPGIAGIVLTIGMAVDANVLVFERIREEIRRGRSALGAIDSGYQRALTTIVDSNLTTFLAAAILFMFGSGPIKGFAVTLMIGIATSMFTALMVTRLVVVTWFQKTKPKKLPLA